MGIVNLIARHSQRGPKRAVSHQLGVPEEAAENPVVFAYKTGRPPVTATRAPEM